MEPIHLVPPDGGYGWIIVIAYGLANVSDDFVIIIWFVCIVVHRIVCSCISSNND